jgi:hypothetical protein
MESESDASDAAAAAAAAGPSNGAAVGTAAGHELSLTLPVKSKRAAGAKPVAVPLVLSEYTLSEIAKMSTSSITVRLFHRQLMQIVLAHSMEHWFSAGTASTAELHQKILNDLTFRSQCLLLTLNEHTDITRVPTIPMLLMNTGTKAFDANSIGTQRKKMKRTVGENVASLQTSNTFRKATGESSVSDLGNRALEVFKARGAGAQYVDESGGEGESQAQEDPHKRPVYWLSMTDRIIGRVWDTSSDATVLRWDAVSGVWKPGESSTGGIAKQIKSEVFAGVPNLAEQHAAMGKGNLNDSTSRRDQKRNEWQTGGKTRESLSEPDAEVGGLFKATLGKADAVLASMQGKTASSVTVADRLAQADKYKSKRELIMDELKLAELTQDQDAKAQARQ